jgi:NADH-quinone oxidoreductase subunit N
MMYLTILATLTATYYAPVSTSPLLTPWLNFTPLARTFTQLFLWIGLATTLLADAFFRRFVTTRGEFYFLLLASIFGLILIGSANDFLTLFLGLETLSISLYILCNYMKQWKISQESAIKFFLTGSIAAAILLYGIALIYGAVGTTQLEGLLTHYQQINLPINKLLFESGIALITLALCFKAAVVPFHQWAPDVYSGASNPVTAFLAVGSKAGAFIAFIQVFIVALPHFDIDFNHAIAILAVPTLIYANYVALKQTELRRFFAYSGISHAGFLLLPIAVGTSEAIPAILFYLVIYSLATLGAFAVTAYLDAQSFSPRFDDLRGLFKKSPIAAGILSLCLLTLGGIPPTAGFFAKFYLFKLAFQAGYVALVIVALLTTILSAYYYLRLVALIFSNATKEEKAPSRLYPALIVGVVTCFGIIALSFFPGVMGAFF